MSNFNNPYAPVLETQSSHAKRFPLAGLDKRFIGAMLDGLVSFAFVLPGLIAIFFDAAQNSQESGGDLSVIGMVGIGWTVVAVLVLAGLQIYLLVTRSQTIGKYLIKTQIVDYQSGEPAGFLKSFVLRSFVSGLIGGIPFVGPIYSIVDILFIFRADRRCLHDMIGGTSVVDISGAA